MDEKESFVDSDEALEGYGDLEELFDYLMEQED